MRAIEQLRDSALGGPSNFSTQLQKLLVEDFDATFSYVKTQKLVFRQRSSAWISGLELEMRDWLKQAPLKGKQKARFARYVMVCNAIQQLLETIDEVSSNLGIWQASTRDLLRSLFESVEDLRLEQESREVGHKFEPEDTLGPLKGIEFVRMELRSYCDYVTRIVNQVPHAGIRQTGLIKPSSSDIREALTVAALDDLVLHILDCYTYKNFRVSVEGKQLKMHALKSRFEEAFTWSSLRARSRDARCSRPHPDDKDSRNRFGSAHVRVPILRPFS